MLNKIKWLIVFLLWIYIILRASFVPITHDEAYSFLLIKTNYIKAMVGTANTHWLNSLGMKFGSIFLGDKPWQLRLFSVLAWLLYGWSAIRISDKIKNPVVSLAFFVALVANPFLLDFFSLARGYGLACAFISASLWKTIKVVDRQDWQSDDWLPCSLLAALAVFSNYTSFYFFIGLIGSYAAFVLLQKKWQVLWPPKPSKWYVLVIGTSIVTITNLLFIKYYTGDLEFGGERLMPSLFGSLVSGSLYLPTANSLTYFLTYLVAALVFSTVGYAVFSYRKTKKITSFTFISFIVVVIFLSNVFFHLIFHNPYLYSRTTLILYPCLITLLFYFFNEIKVPVLFTYVGKIASFVFIVVLCLHFFRCYNYQYCYEWKFQAESKKCFDVLVKEKPQHVFIGTWYYGVLVNYYKATGEKEYAFEYEGLLPNEVAEAPASFVNKIRPDDYGVLVPPYNFENLRKQNIQVTVLKQFPLTGAAVVKFTRTEQ